MPQGREMEPHEKRVEKERKELSVKMDALVEFMHGDVYASLRATEQGLLMVQLEAMKMYHNTLKRRIEIFESK